MRGLGHLWSRPIGAGVRASVGLFAIVSTVLIGTYFLARPSLEESSVTILDMAPATWEVADSEIVSGPPITLPTFWYIRLDPTPGQLPSLGSSVEALRTLASAAESEKWTLRQLDTNELVAYHFERESVRFEANNAGGVVAISIRHSYTPLLQQMALVAAGSLVTGAGVGWLTWRRDRPSR